MFLSNPQDSFVAGQVPLVFFAALVLFEGPVLAG